VIGFFARACALIVGVSFSGCAAYEWPRRGETVHRSIPYVKREARTLALDLYVPAQPRPAPVVLWIHGGGWKFGHKGFNLLVRDLVDHGFAVASVEYRLLGAAPWPAAIDDCHAALEWVRRHGDRFGLDPRRVCVAGESAGGHLAALLGTQAGSSRLAAVCALYPPTDLVAMGRRYSKFKRASIILQMFGGQIEDRFAAARFASPITYVSRRSPPFLLYHGDRDWLVPLAQSEALHRHLRARGVECKLRVVPGAGHAFPLSDMQLREVAQFFRRHL
jgi:acetyl esterase/lipase